MSSILFPTRVRSCDASRKKTSRRYARCVRALECEATRCACGRIELAELHALADSFRQIKKVRRRGAAFVDRARHFDSQLHDLISDSCGNRFLAKEIGRLKLLFRAFRDASWELRVANNDFYRFGEEAEEHLAIVEALIAGDGKEPRGQWHVTYARA